MRPFWRARTKCAHLLRRGSIRRVTVWRHASLQVGAAVAPSASVRFLLVAILACAACDDGGARGAPDAASSAADAGAAADASVAADATPPDAAPRACDDRATASARCQVGFLCAASASCWSAQIDCASAVDCDGDGKLDLACPCGQRADCARRTCGAAAGAPPLTCAHPVEDARCGEDLPLYCAGQSSCVAEPSVDCASLRDCDGDGVFESTCGCGLAVDCSTHTCRALARARGAPIGTSGGDSEEDTP